MRRRLTRFLRSGAALRRRRGFTLIESLAAFAILTMVFGQLLSGISGAARNESRADFLVRAARQGQSQLAALGADGKIQPGLFEGRYDDGLVWRLAIAPGAVAKSQSGAPMTASYAVELVIRRPDGDGELPLATVKIISTPPIGAGQPLGPQLGQPPGQARGGAP